MMISKVILKQLGMISLTIHNFPILPLLQGLSLARKLSPNSRTTSKI